MRHDWRGTTEANFAVFFREGRAYPRLRGLAIAPSVDVPKYDMATGIQWGRATATEDLDGWESSYFVKRSDAISYAKDRESEFFGSRERRSEDQLRVEVEVYGASDRFLELYVADRHGNVFWDFPKTVHRPISALVISKNRWRYLLLPWNRTALKSSK